MLINPIKYPGNKTKILSQLLPELETSHAVLVDVFGGSGVVSINTKYNLKVINDRSAEAIKLLEYFYYNESQTIIENTLEIIKKYNLTYSKIKPKGFYEIFKNEGLSKHNRKSYIKLRESYNKTKDVEKLFVLVIYGFNHYVRFNRKGEFNIPVGKGDFSDSIYRETVNFVDGIKKSKITFSNKDFRNEELYKYEDAVFYFDPPYLITRAPYNDSWSLNDENELLNLLDRLNNENKKFVLSNVLESNGKKNELLIKWANRYNVIEVKRQYRNANYQKDSSSYTREVIIKNF